MGPRRLGRLDPYQAAVSILLGCAWEERHFTGLLAHPHEVGIDKVLATVQEAQTLDAEALEDVADRFAARDIRAYLDINGLSPASEGRSADIVIAGLPECLPA
ncbi:hypothetical protein D3C87_1745420 [compost metagenome]